MNWYSLNKFAQVQKISLQEATDRKMFGPVYHGTSAENREKIDAEGFKVFIGDTGSAGMSNGYGIDNYGATNAPPPIHHIGFGHYFTTNKTIAKMFAGGTTRGMKTYYLDVPRLLEINWGSPNTMMKWWISMGYDPQLAKVDRVAATMKMTETIKSQHDAVWYKGKGLRKLLDGDQVCVYDTSKIYEIDKAMSQSGEIGAKVRRKTDGMIGTIISKKDVSHILEQYPLAATWLKPGTKWRLYVKWNKGGMDSNVQDIDVEFL